MHPDMKEIKCVIMRGGTSKGIYIMENQLPSEAKSRDKVIKAIFGSPDVRQIDGLGGADTLTSKLAIISPPSRDDVDVDYTFAQVGIDQDIVDYGGNCGNISAAVGPFAIDEGLVKAVEPVTQVRIYQRNTGKILVADVPVKNGKARVDGELHIDGVPGTGAKITMDFSDTLGSVTGKLLPTGKATNLIEAEKTEYEVSIVDAGIPVVFIKAEDLDMKGTESPSEIEGNKELMRKIECIRGKAAEKIGIVGNWEEAAVKSPYMPFFAIVSAPQDYKSISGSVIRKDKIDFVSRLLFMLKMHKAYPGTGSVCTGVAARITGSVVWDVMKDKKTEKDEINIGHPSGIMKVESIMDNSSKSIKFKRLAFYRTARRIMEGYVYIKNSVLDD